MAPIRTLALLTILFAFARTLAAADAPAAKPEPGGEKPKDPAFAPVTDDPKLPRVLIVGDSISIGYTLDVRQRLAGRANVHRIPTNGGPTSNGVANVEKWLGDSKWDVIHFNFGLHDLKGMPDGKRQVEPEAYEANLRRIVEAMKRTGAALVWATTTPVPEGKQNPPRKTEDVIAYNAAAARVMAEAGVATDDLYAFALPRVKEIQRPNNVHFTAKGSAALGEQVAASIEAALAKRK